MRLHRAPSRFSSARAAALVATGTLGLSGCLPAQEATPRKAPHEAASGATAQSATQAVPVQEATPRKLPVPGQRVCSASMTAVAVRVVDAAGAPVNDAVVELRRVAGDALVLTKNGAISDRGDYVLFDDSSAPTIKPRGEAFTVVATSRGRRAVVKLTLGFGDPDGCHVAVLAGEQKLVVR